MPIGNSTYDHDPLSNPSRDAKAMAALLRQQLAFDVSEEHNASQAAMERALKKLLAKKH